MKYTMTYEQRIKAIKTIHKRGVISLYAKEQMINAEYKLYL